MMPQENELSNARHPMAKPSKSLRARSPYQPVNSCAPLRILAPPRHKNSLLVPNCRNNVKTNSFRCSTRWKSKWRNNRRYLITSESWWLLTVITSYEGRNSWNCSTNNFRSKLQPSEQPCINGGRPREQQVSRSSCPRGADPEVNHGAKLPHHPNPTTQLHNPFLSMKI